MKYIVIRKIYTDECPWLYNDISSGTILFGFPGHTYGCVSGNGRAVTLKDGETPFFEVPKDAIEVIKCV